MVKYRVMYIIVIYLHLSYFSLIAYMFLQIDHLEKHVEMQNDKRNWQAACDEVTSFHLFCFLGGCEPPTR